MTSDTDYALEAAEHEIKRLEAKNYEAWDQIERQRVEIRKLSIEGLALKRLLSTAEMRKRNWMFVAAFAVVAAVITLAL